MTSHLPSLNKYSFSRQVSHPVASLLESIKWTAAVSSLWSQEQHTCWPTSFCHDTDLSISIMRTAFVICFQVAATSTDRIEIAETSTYSIEIAEISADRIEVASRDGIAAQKRSNPSHPSTDLHAEPTRTIFSSRDVLLRYQAWRREHVRATA